MIMPNKYFKNMNLILFSFFTLSWNEVTIDKFKSLVENDFHVPETNLKFRITTLENPIYSWTLKESGYLETLRYDHPEIEKRYISRTFDHGDGRLEQLAPERIYKNDKTKNKYLAWFKDLFPSNSGFLYHEFNNSDNLSKKLLNLLNANSNLKVHQEFFKKLTN
jgi:hypothetical protein